MAVMMSACGQQPSDPLPHGPEFGQFLPWSGEAFEIMAEDLDADHLLDLTVIDHGKNQAQIFYHTTPRGFELGQNFLGVGFHPGNILRWSTNEPPELVLAAEGDNAVRVLVPDRAAGFKVQANIKEVKPRYAGRFSWPGWGSSLVLSPFDMDSLFLLKGFNPADGSVQDRVVVPLSKNPPSVLWPGPVTVADIDGDHIDDLLYATSVTRQIYVIRGANKDSGIKPELLAEDPDWGGVTQVVPVDMEQDGRIDLLAPDEAAPGRINVLKNRGNGEFSKGITIDFPNQNGITKIKAAVDGDGLQYVLAGGFGALALYQIPRDWTAGQPLPFRHLRWGDANYATAMVFQDLDNDGWLDLILARAEGDRPLWVLFGPLWKNFEDMSNKGFDLDKSISTNEKIKRVK